MKWNKRICAEALFFPLFILTAIATTPVVAAVQKIRLWGSLKPISPGNPFGSKNFRQRNSPIQGSG
jgi:hypothetical protein